MSNSLQGKVIAFLVAPEGVEQVELTSPSRAVEDADGTPEIVSTASGTIQAFNHLDRGGTFTVDRTVDTATADDFDGLVLPGGVANPDMLRMNQDAVEFASDFFRMSKPVAVICHGAWTLVEADRVRGRRMTSYPSLATDIRNAGGHWVDEEVVVCDDGPNVLVSSRRPDDLDAFCATLVEQFARAE